MIGACLCKLRSHVQRPLYDEPGPSDVTSIDAHIGRRLRARRTELQLTVAQAAERLDMPVPWYGAVEQGTERLPAADMQRAAEAFEVPLGYFFAQSAGAGPADAERDEADAVRRDEGAALNRAFVQIRDPKVRADIIEHVEAAARYERELRRREDRGGADSDGPTS